MTDLKTSLLECPHCGLVQHTVADRPGHVMVCVRCESRLHTGPRHAHGLSSACVGMAALLFLIATGSPVFEMHLLGRYAAAGLMTGPVLLDHRGLPELSAVVFVTLLVAPTVHLLILVLALIGSRMRNPHRYWFLPLGLAETARHWSMLDVFLLASLVCYMRLHVWANVQVGGAIAAMIVLSLVTYACEQTLDPHVLWEQMPWHRPNRPTTHREQARLISCSWCELIGYSHEGERCARCGHTLHARKKRSLARSGALLLAAAFLTIPANVLPVMDTIQFGRNDTNTIYSGVIELTEQNLWGLAVIIFAASIVIPLIKIVAMTLLLVTTAHKSPAYLRARTRTFQFVRSVGRWSMVDVFAVTILVSLVHMGALATVLPRYGAVAFCGVVLLTMLASEAFDPRLMWDAAGMNGPSPNSPPFAAALPRRAR